jgi:hypothetical protein
LEIDHMLRLTIAAALALGAAPALGQDDQNAMPDHGTPNGMVSVSVPNLDVLGDFVSKDQAAALKDELPLTIQMPLGVAADVCSVNAADLAKAKKGTTPSCTARNGSRSLAEQVLKAAKKPPKE